MKFETVNHINEAGMQGGSFSTPIKSEKNVKNLTSRKFSNRKNASELYVDLNNNK